MTAAPAGAGLFPVRPLAVQAHALRAAAAFIEQAGIAGLSLNVDEDEIVIQVPARLAGQAARTAAVARLAAAAGGRARPWHRRWARAEGQIAGHRAVIFTAVEEQEAP